jgi:hypothetical protein
VVIAITPACLVLQCSSRKDFNMMPYSYINGTPISMYFLMALAGFVFANLIALIKRRAFNLRVRDVGTA